MRLVIWIIIAAFLTQGYALQAQPEPDLQAPIEDVF